MLETSILLLDGNRFLFAEIGRKDWKPTSFSEVRQWYNLWLNKQTKEDNRWGNNVTYWVKFRRVVNSLSANPTKCSNTFKQFVDYSLSLFEHFVRLALRWLRFWIASRRTDKNWSLLCNISFLLQCESLLVDSLKSKQSSSFFHCVEQFSF